MKYKVKLDKKVEKFLNLHLNLRKRFFSKISLLAIGETETLDIKHLKGTKNDYRLRIGDYRFLYKVIDDKILIYFYNAGSRGDIYK